MKIIKSDVDCIATAKGIIVVLVTPKGELDPCARRVNKLTRGSLTRLISSKKFEEEISDNTQQFNFNWSLKKLDSVLHNLTRFKNVLCSELMMVILNLSIGEFDWNLIQPFK